MISPSTEAKQTLTDGAILGKVLPIGGEWALVDANKINGSLTNDVRQTFQTDDGAVIQIFETGQTQPDGTAYLRLAFETGSDKYYWINSVVAIGHLRTVSASSLTIDAWQVSVACPRKITNGTNRAA